MRIVETLDVFEHRGFRLSVSFEVMSIQQLALKTCKEALGHRVVEAISDRSHRGTNPELFAAFAESDRGVLGAVVRVVDHRLRTALGERAFDRGDHQLGSQMIFHCPSRQYAD